MGIFWNDQKQFYSLFEVLNNLNAEAESFAESLNIPAAVLFIIGAVLAVGVGFFGYKLIKLLIALGSAGIGYFAGHALYYSIVCLSGVDMPEWLTYVFGGVLALVLCVLAFKKFSYMMYTVMAVIGYCVALFYSNGSQRVAIGAAILLGLLSMFAVRFVFILLTSFAGSAVLMGSLSALLPEVELLQLSETNYLSLLIALGVIVVFMIVQFLITRTKREKTAKEEKEKKKKKKKNQKRTDDEDIVVMTTPGIQGLISGKFFK